MSWIDLQIPTDLSTYLTASTAASTYVPLNRSASSTIIANGTVLTTTDSKKVLRFDASGGDFTQDLPTASSMSGYTLECKGVSATGVVTFDASGAETIDGSTTRTMTGRAGVRLYSNGTSWDAL